MSFKDFLEVLIHPRVLEAVLYFQSNPNILFSEYDSLVSLVEAEIRIDLNSFNSIRLYRNGYLINLDIIDRIYLWDQSRYYVKELKKIKKLNVLMR